MAGGARVAASAAEGMGVIPSSLLARLLLSIRPDGKKAPMPPNSGKPLEGYRETLAELLGLLASGSITPVVAGRMPLLEAARAHQLLERGGHAGKVVLVSG